MAADDDVRAWVRDYYGRVLQKSADLATNACCATGAPPSFLAAKLANVHDDVLARFYGCGFPIPEAVTGATVVDLGCGTGRDVYLLSQLVGPDGFVHGVDMTDSQLQVARDTVAWHTERFGYAQPNVAFHQGYIEDLRPLPIADGSVDVVVSNCVVNLSPRKDLVLAEVFRILKPGGEFYFSDVFCDRRLPETVAFDPLLHSECLGGAMYRADFETLAKQVGFLDPRAISTDAITIQNAEVQTKVGAARFESTTLRLLKLADLDPQCEDYGQVATFRGGVPGVGQVFWLDQRHAFEVGRPERVCRNSAAMLTDTRFAPFFEVQGAAEVHFGPFDCAATMAASAYGSAQATAPRAAPAPEKAKACGPKTGGCC